VAALNEDEWQRKRAALDDMQRQELWEVAEKSKDLHSAMDFHLLSDSAAATTVHLASSMWRDWGVQHCSGLCLKGPESD
jgi:hypothetical protein